MGNWWLAAPSQQRSHSRIMCGVLGKHQITQVTQHPLQPRFGTLKLLSFPKTEITFEKEEISDHQWDSGKYDREADSDWKNCVRSQCAYFEGDWGVIVLSTMFLVSCIFLNKCLYLLYYMAVDTFWHIYIHTYIHTLNTLYIVLHIYYTICALYCICYTMLYMLYIYYSMYYIV